ncbi:glycosyltransferase family 4 protein [Aridibaculum aurantiacum]|uniref:glycosyltransferase family 4 protein n=1 Tax=Aridibaculum aurantiacum TaxID=2810307 RepID=UPI001A964FE7|nr:glycosyltransferase family 1 protein [Aridibaculum aurantiacum]
MRIAVNARFLVAGELEGYGYFTKEVFYRVAQQHPEHEFLFLFDREIPTNLALPANVTPLVIKPAARHAFSFRWWFDVKVPLALLKHKADVFVSPDGFCSLTTFKPQVLVVHDLAFLHFPRFIPKHHLFFYKTHTGKFLRKAKVVATVSEFSKADIIKRYKTPAEKIINVGSAAKAVFKPVDWEQREEVKEKYAQGFEYFLFVGGIHPRKNLLNLLKAFSNFKKWQRTNMKLLVAGKKGWMYDDTLGKLKTYKYRDEVILLDYLPEEALAQVVASAYAVVYPSFFEGFGVPIVEAMQCEVPVLTSNSSSMPEVGGDAALYADADNPQAIADNMQRIFKDEKLRSSLIEKGKEQARKFTWDATADLMWNAIEKAVSK